MVKALIDRELIMIKFSDVDGQQQWIIVGNMRNDEMWLPRQSDFRLPTLNPIQVQLMFNLIDVESFHNLFYMREKRLENFPVFRTCLKP